MGCGTIPNSHANLLRSEHLVTCAAKVMLTLTSSSALNNATTLFSPSAQERLCSSWRTRAPRLCPLSKEPGQVQGEACWLSLTFPLTLSLTVGLWPPQVVGKTSSPAWGLSGSRSYPSLHAFSRNSSSSLGSPGPGRGIQQLLLLPGWHGVRSGTQKPRFSPCSCCG